MAIQTRQINPFRGFDFQRGKKHDSGRVMVRVLPGGVYCTQQNELISTGLGSCISVCAWDRQVGIGGMNHFLLPFTDVFEAEQWQVEDAVSAPSRYGNYAMEIIINQLIELGARRERLCFKVFGGAQMLGKQSMIGEKNIEFVLDYIAQEALVLKAHDLGGVEPRKIIFDPQSGRVWLKRIPFLEADEVCHAEGKYAQRASKQAHLAQDDVEIFL